MTNSEFIDYMFGNRAPETQPMVCAFRDDPGHHSDWSGQPWRGSVSANGNTFVALSSFKRTGRQYRCTKSAFDALHFVMFDDVKDQDWPLPPTYRIETSPGNLQIGFALDAPMRDVALASRLLSELARSVDNFGANNVTRWARMPEGINTKRKYGGGTPQRLLAFDDRRYSWEELAKSYGTRVVPPREYRGPRFRLTGDQCSKVIPLMRLCGYYRRALGGGRHAVICPNREEHSHAHQGRTDTVYFEPSEENFGRGGFHCLHSHCADWGIDELLGVCDFIEYELAQKGTTWNAETRRFEQRDQHERSGESSPQPNKGKQRRP